MTNKEKKQKRFRKIDKFIKKHKREPILKEISKICNFKSQSYAHQIRMEYQLNQTRCPLCNHKI